MSETVEGLAQRARELKDQVERAKARFRMGAATYDEMAEAAKAYSRAFEQYHKAKYGKSKRIDYRALLR